LKIKKPKKPYILGFLGFFKKPKKLGFFKWVSTALDAYNSVDGERYLSSVCWLDAVTPSFSFSRAWAWLKCPCFSGKCTPLQCFTLYII